MKSEGALRMRFMRHGGIYRSDVSFLLFTLGPCPAFRSGRCQGIGHAGKNMPCPSSAMSSGRLFLDGLLASIARLRFTGMIRIKLLPLRMECIYHRTVHCLLTVCLTSGDKPNPFLLLRRLLRRPALLQRRDDRSPAGGTQFSLRLSWRYRVGFTSRRRPPFPLRLGDCLSSSGAHSLLPNRWRRSWR